MCNLNFNQCNGGSYYPPLLDTCRAQLRSMFNASTTTVINPVLQQSFLFAAFFEPQNVVGGGRLVLSRQASSGLSITDNGDGSYLLGSGTYSVEYSASALVPPELLSLGLTLDGVTLEGSGATSNAVGQTVDLVGRAVFTVGSGGGLLALNNLLNNNIIVNRSNLIINRLN